MMVVFFLFLVLMSFPRRMVSGYSLGSKRSTVNLTQLGGVTPMAVQFVDEKKELESSNFPIKPDDLIVLARETIGKLTGLTDDGECLAEDFEFVAPIIGPLGKQEFLKAVKGFDLAKAFPDLQTRYYNVHCDPFDHDRVWYMTRPLATHKGSLFGKEPSGVRIEAPPQANSLRFNAQGKVKEYTIGYVIDRRIGNTGGLGGAFAFFYAVGQALPFPECQPYKKSFRFRFFNWIGRIGAWLNKNKN
jgi:hypothetical protein